MKADSGNKIMRYLLVFVMAVTVAAGPQVTDENYKMEMVGNAEAGFISMAFGPKGQMYMAEKRGRVVIYKKG
ncbi:MAG: hypothetical protein HRT88_13740, partial [Lentisphaeraceae bacterium]|nr:hypothetical protein [Lentisphaeraceae bacterium]